MKNMKIAALVIALGVALVANAEISVLTTYTLADGGVGSGRIYGLAVEGETAYVALSLNNLPQMVRIDNLNGVQTRTQLFSPAQWVAASGNTSFVPFYGPSIYGNYLYFGDSIADVVWRVDKTTPGNISVYADKQSITNVTGFDACSFLTPHQIDPNTGWYYFYESTSDGIMAATGMNAVIEVATSAELTAFTGNDSVAGIGIDDESSVYWGSNTSDSMYKRTVTGSYHVVLSQANIIGITGESACGFNDILQGKDGLVYFYETTSDGIMRFDPDNPAGTLETFLSEADLNSSTAATDNVSTLSWYGDDTGGGPAWHSVLADKDVYTCPIPEPGLLLGGLGIALMLFRRK
jgi:hypothetical protein